MDLDMDMSTRSQYAKLLRQLADAGNSAAADLEAKNDAVFVVHLVLMGLTYQAVGPLMTELTKKVQQIADAKIQQTAERIAGSSPETT